MSFSGHLIAILLLIFSLRLALERSYQNQLTQDRLPYQRLRATHLMGPSKVKIRSTCFFLALMESWLSIFTVGSFFSNSSTVPYVALAILFCAGRFRALQEITHYAIHGSLGSCRSLQRLAADVFFQAPLIRGPARHRFVTHVHRHHPNANSPDTDPNVEDLIDAGWFDAGTRHFYSIVLFPLSLRGLVKEFTNLWQAVTSFGIFWMLTSLFFVALVISGLYVIGGTIAVLCCYVIPRVVVYPSLAWWSQLMEHRWCIESSGLLGKEREFVVGHRLALSGFGMLFAKYYLCPFGDYYHLAHSLYPRATWLDLSGLDQMLLHTSPEYSKFSKTAYFDKRFPEMGVFSELLIQFKLAKTPKA